MTTMNDPRRASADDPAGAGRTRGRIRRRAVAATAALLTAAGSLTVVPQPAAAAAPNFTGDPTQYWNTTLIEIFKQLRGPDAAPGKLARAAAMMNASIFDAETMYQDRWGVRRYQPYLGAGSYPAILEGPNEEERVIGRTAYNVLRDLFGPNTNPSSPDQTSYLDQRFRNRFGSEPTGFDILDTTVVQPVVSRMRAFRANDRSDDTSVYPLQNVPGAWRPTGGACNEAAKAVGPEWGAVKPFAIASGDAYRPPTPQSRSTYQELLATQEYKNQVATVRRLGGAASTAATPNQRTAEQTAIALFWANDVDGTYKPVGQLLDHTRLIAQQRGVTGKYENARLFALVSLSLADASIAAWDAKYRTPIDLWRPESAIRDGGLDPDWRPLSADLNGVHFSPCFPAWVSGHATFAAAWAETMRSYFEGDFTFTVTTGDPSAPVRSKTFTSFGQAAQENADSRVYLGVHYPWDAVDGMAIGKKVAADVYANKLTSIPAVKGAARRD
ncbi:vanadium-dependent haloperoxidase [Streptosporangium sandarakinum]